MHRLFVCATATLLLCGCNSSTDPAPTQTTDARVRPDSPMPPPSDDLAAPGQAPQGASVKIAPTQGNTVTGALSLTAEAEGVRFTGAVQGLKPNAEFGFHVHEKGDCSAPDASSAGGHFNPNSQPHGNPDSQARHTGDMHNLRSNEQGTAEVDVVAQGATLHSGAPTDVLGKAVVVHESPDDYQSQPSGNSGARIACGVIGVQPPAATQ